MALITTGLLPRQARASLAAFGAQATAWLRDSGESSRTRRLAGTAFLIRVGGAALAYAAQILLAQWMGAFEFGIYVYVWTWVLLLAGFVDLGLGTAAQRLIPEYRQRGRDDLLRGFQSGSRRLAIALAAAAAAISALAVWLLEPRLNRYEVLPLYIACLALPMAALLQVQSGVARAHDWMNLAQLPTYIFRQLLIIAGVGAVCLLGSSADASDATLISVAAVWTVALGQLWVLNGRLAQAMPPGPQARPVKNWLTVSVPMLIADGFYLLLTSSSIILLHLFQTPRELAVYYAAEKTLALVAFVHFAVAQSTAHGFSRHHVAGDRARLTAALDHAVRLTLWPSLAAIVVVLAAGIPLLRLFGSAFVDGYPLMFIFAVGMLARAAVGPLGSFLYMIGQSRICTGVAAAALALNVGLGWILIPSLGIAGAAVSFSAALVLESAALFVITRLRLGYRAAKTEARA